MERSEILKKDYRMAVLMALPMVASVLIYWFVLRSIEPPKVVHDAIDVTRYLLYAVALSGVGFIFVLKRIYLKKAPRENLSKLLGKLKSSTFATLALCEAPAVYGLIIYFIGGPRSDFYILAAYSLCLFAVFFPRFAQWQEYTADASAG